MRSHLVGVLGIVAVVGCGESGEPAMREEGAALREESPSLLAMASVDYERALAVALERSGGGVVEEAELEEEGELLIYSFELRLANGSLHEVEVDAMSGEVLDDDVEDEDDEDDEDSDDDDTREHAN